MGDEREKSQEATKDMMLAMQQYLPGVLKVINEGVGPTAKAQLEADKAVSPGYSELQTQLYSKYGPELAKIGRDIEAKNQLAASERELALIKGPGQELVTEADKAQRVLDPEYYRLRPQLEGGVNKYLSSMSPTELSGSERAEVERSIGRSGFTHPGSALTTAANAMTFGKELQQKQDRFGQALQVAASTLAPLRTGANAFEIATRRALGTPAAGEQRFTGAQQGTGGQAYGVGSNFMSQFGAFKGQEMSKQKSTLDQILQGTQAFSNVVGSVSGAVPGMH